MRRVLGVGVVAVVGAGTAVGIVYARDGAPAARLAGAGAVPEVRFYSLADPGPAISGIRAGDRAVPSAVQSAFRDATPAVVASSARSALVGEEMLAIVADDVAGIVVLATVKASGSVVSYTSAPPAAIADGHLALTMSNPETDGDLTVGVVPDGVESVVAHERDGSTRAVKVTSNVYAVRTSQTASLSWELAGRQVHQQLADH